MKVWVEHVRSFVILVNDTLGMSSGCALIIVALADGCSSILVSVCYVLRFHINEIMPTNNDLPFTSSDRISSQPALGTQQCHKKMSSLPSCPILALLQVASAVLSPASSILPPIPNALRPLDILCQHH